MILVVLDEDRLKGFLRQASLFGPLFQFYLRRSDSRKPVGWAAHNARQLHHIRLPPMVGLAPPKRAPVH
jgi:hypothetical protein